MITKSGALKALKNRQKIIFDQTQFNLENHLFPEQLAFVRDKSSNKVAMCSRRSGKSTACAADLVFTAINNPNTVSLYITLSRANAKRIIWKEIKTLNKNYNLNGLESLSELSFTFPNGSTIYLSGAKDSTEIEKFRGLALILVYIDEAQSFRSHIKELINDVLAPALLDYAGTMALIGTPPPIPNGFFMDTFQNPSTTWGKHAWTFFNNPFIVKKSKLSHEELLQRELDRRGVSKDDPSIQREFFGKCIPDTNSLLIHYDKIKNDIHELPKLLPDQKYNYVLGVDIGHDDADALAVLAWHESSPNIYLVEERLNRGQDITDLMNMIAKLRTQYDISKMVIDTGGLGKKITEELIRRHQMPLQPADKARKMENVALLNDFLRTGRFKAISGSKFSEDAFLVEIDRDKSTPDKIKVSDRYHSDIIDAVLYAFKECHAYAYEAPIIQPQPGTPEWYAKQQSEMFDQAMEHFKQNELNKSIFD